MLDAVGAFQQTRKPLLEKARILGEYILGVQPLNACTGEQSLDLILSHREMTWPS